MLLDEWLPISPLIMWLSQSLGLVLLSMVEVAGSLSEETAGIPEFAVLFCLYKKIILVVLELSWLLTLSLCLCLLH